MMQLVKKYSKVKKMKKDEVDSQLDPHYFYQIQGRRKHWLRWKVRKKIVEITTIDKIIGMKERVERKISIKAKEGRKNYMSEK